MIVTEPPGWGEPGTIRHAEKLTPAPRVDLRHHGRFDTYPLPLATQQLLAAGQAAIDDLERATARTQRARADIARPEYCHAKAVGTKCVRTVHPMWEQHEDWEGNTWFSGEAPR